MEIRDFFNPYAQQGVDDVRVRKSNRPSQVPFGYKVYRCVVFSLSIDFIVLAPDQAHAEVFARRFIFDEFDGLDVFLTIHEYNDFFILG